jgi:type I restriction enzyme, S subunit
MTTAAAKLTEESLALGTRRFQRYAETSNSAIPFVRRLPSHWRVEKLKHVASVRFSSVDKKTEEGESPIRLCNYTDVYNRDTIVDDPEFMQASATPAEIARHTLKKGDVLITKDSEEWNDIAVPAYVTADMPGVLCGYHLAHIRPHPAKLDGAFLSRAFAADGIRQQFHIAANGITRYGLPNRAISGALFPIPPLNEQLAIAKFLDQETGTIDKLITKNLTMIGRLYEARLNFVSRAVNIGINPDVALVQRSIPWLRQIPAHWQIKRLKHYMKRIEQGWSPQCENRPAEPGEWGVLKVGCMNTGTYDETENKVLPTNLEPETYYEVRIGDVLMSRSNTAELVGSVGRVRATQGRILVCDKLYRIVFAEDQLNPDYAIHLLRSIAARQQIERDATGASASMKNISNDRVENLLFAFPDVTEQAMILASIEETTRRIDTLIDGVTCVIGVLRQHRSALISNAITGRIDVRNFRSEALCQ